MKIRSWQVTLILTLFFMAVAGAAGIGWWYARESPAHQGPIVLIAVDGMKAAPVSNIARASVAPADAPVPAAVPPSPLEAFIRDSVVFERAYIHDAQLLPSHLSLVSGQLPFEHGVRDDAGFTLAPDTRTLAELLRNRGFATGAAVTSFLLRGDTGAGRGFSYYGDTESLDTPRTPDVAPEIAAKADANAAAAAPQPTTPDASADAEPDETTRTVDNAAKWAIEQRGHRFFLMLQVDAAHADAAIERMVTLLRQRRLYDGATIVVVGDRGSDKGSMDEETLHVPLLVKQPQREGAGRRVGVLVQHIDLLPTILDLVRAPIPSGLRGRSLKPLLEDADARITPQPVYAESLAPAFRFSGSAMYALTLNESRYLRGSNESLLTLDATSPFVRPADTLKLTDGFPIPSAELPPLRATLDRLLSGRPIPRAGLIAARDRSRLALSGHLQGLRTIEEVSGLSLQQQDEINSAHRAAALLVGEGRLVAGLRALQQIGRSAPALASVQYQIGEVALQLGRTQDAIVALEAAAALRPDSPQVLSALAVALTRGGEQAHAEARISSAIEAAAPLGPVEIAAAHETAVRLALSRNDAQAATHHADAVQAANPEIPMRAFVQGVVLANQGADVEAEPVLQEAAAMLRQQEVSLEGVHLTLADVLSRLDKLPAAEAEYREELRSFPRSVAAYQGLTTVLHKQDRDSEAGLTIAELLQASPTPDAYSAAARLWVALGNPARAAAVRSDARERFPNESAQGRFARVKAR